MFSILLFVHIIFNQYQICQIHNLINNKNSYSPLQSDKMLQVAMTRVVPDTRPPMSGSLLQMLDQELEPGIFITDKIVTN